MLVPADTALIFHSLEPPYQVLHMLVDRTCVISQRKLIDVQNLIFWLTSGCRKETMNKLTYPYILNWLNITPRHLSTLSLIMFSQNATLLICLCCLAINSSCIRIQVREYLASRCSQQLNAFKRWYNVLSGCVSEFDQLLKGKLAHQLTTIRPNFWPLAGLWWRSGLISLFVLQIEWAEDL